MARLMGLDVGSRTVGIAVSRTAVCPAVGLLIVVRAVESPREVLCIPCDADFGIDNFFFTAVIQ